MPQETLEQRLARLRGGSTGGTAQPPAPSTVAAPQGPVATATPPAGDDYLTARLKALRGGAPDPADFSDVSKGSSTAHDFSGVSGGSSSVDSFDDVRGGRSTTARDPALESKAAAAFAKAIPIDDDSDFMRGVVGGFVGQNPGDTGNFLKTVGAEEAGAALDTFGDRILESYRPRIARLRDASSVGEALDWAQYTVGQALASSAPSVAAGMVGGAIGAATTAPAGGTGAIPGALIGAAVPSYIQSVGQVRAQLEELGVEDPAKLRMVALGLGIPITALDVIVPGDVASKIIKRLAESTAGKAGLKYLVKEGLKAGGREMIQEGATEGLQTVVETVGTHIAAGKPIDPKDLALEVGESAIGGALGGGALGVGGHVVGEAGHELKRRVVGKGAAAPAAAAPDPAANVQPAAADAPAVPHRALELSREFLNGQTTERLALIRDFAAKQVAAGAHEFARRVQLVDAILAKRTAATAPAPEAAAPAAAPVEAPAAEPPAAPAPLTEAEKHLKRMKELEAEEAGGPPATAVAPIEPVDDVEAFRRREAERPPAPAPSAKVEDRLRYLKGITTSTAQPGDIIRAPLEELHADPTRFQFKAGTDEKGVTKELAGVETFNEDLGGVISVWRDSADGKSYVVNGHHRFELAQRTKHPSLNVRYLDAKTAEEARSMGAVINIAEGRGTAVDAAKFLRDSGRTMEDLKASGVSVKGAIAKDGAALAKLANDLFDQVASGKLETKAGAAIGAMLEDHAQQRTAAKVVASSAKTLSAAEVTEIARQVRDAGSASVTEESLFGSETVDRPLFVETAQLAASFKKKLGGDKRLFGFVSKGTRAEELRRAGNDINVDESAKLAGEAARLEEVFDALYTRSGPIADALRAGAKRIAQGERVADVVGELYDEVRAAVEATFKGTAAGARRAESEASAGAASEVGATDPAQDALFDPANELDLFGKPVKSTAPAQASMFGAKEGTEASRNLRQTEAASRSELERLRAQLEMEPGKEARIKIQSRIAQLEKLVNRDQAIGVEELKARLEANKSEGYTKPEEPGQSTLFERNRHDTLTFGSPAVAERVRRQVDKHQLALDFTKPVKRKVRMPHGPHTSLESKTRLANLRTRPKGWVDIRGMDASTPAQVHAMMFPFRHPKMERFHVILTDDNGKILSHTMTTSGAINYSSVPEKLVAEIGERARRMGATRAIISHNHPSGDPTPSADDIAITGAVGYVLQSKYGVFLDGHYVIDHDTGTWISPDPALGRITSKAVDAANMTTRKAVDWTAKMAPVTRPQLVHALMRGVEPAPDTFAVLYLDSQMGVVAVEPHHRKALQTIGTWLDASMRGHGARRTIFVTGGSETSLTTGMADSTFDEVVRVLNDRRDKPTETRKVVGVNDVSDVINIRGSAFTSAEEAGILETAAQPAANDEGRPSRRVFEKAKAPKKTSARKSDSSAAAKNVALLETAIAAWDQMQVGATEEKGGEALLEEFRSSVAKLAAELENQVDAAKLLAYSKVHDGLRAVPAKVLEMAIMGEAQAIADHYIAIGSKRESGRTRAIFERRSLLELMYPRGSGMSARAAQTFKALNVADLLMIADAQELHELKAEYTKAAEAMMRQLPGRVLEETRAKYSTDAAVEMKQHIVDEMAHAKTTWPSETRKRNAHPATIEQGKIVFSLIKWVERNKGLSPEKFLKGYERESSRLMRALMHEHGAAAAIALPDPSALRPLREAPNTEPELVIIPCGGTKLDRRAPAAELYTGGYFKSALKYARSLTSDARIRILSGKHGLVRLDEELDPYEQRIDEAGAVSSDKLRSQVELEGAAGMKHVRIVGGADYIDALAPMIPQAYRVIDPGMGIGEHLGRLKRLTEARAAERSSGRQGEQLKLLEAPRHVYTARAERTAALDRLKQGGGDRVKATSTTAPAGSGKPSTVEFMERAGVELFDVAARKEEAAAAEEGREYDSSNDDLWRCTTVARAMVKQLGGVVMGYSFAKNPDAKIGLPQQRASLGDDTGHDFALVRDRYVVDPWATLVSEESDRAVFDLEIPADAARVRELYGDRSTWEVMPEGTGHAEASQLQAKLGAMDALRRLQKGGGDRVKASSSVRESSPEYAARPYGTPALRQWDHPGIDGSDDPVRVRHIRYLEALAQRVELLNREQPTRTAQIMEIIDGDEDIELSIATPGGRVMVHMNDFGDELGLNRIERDSRSFGGRWKEGANTIGPMAMRDVFRELGRAFPEARDGAGGTGDRVTGIRFGPAGIYGDGHAVATRFKLSEDAAEYSSGKVERDYETADQDDFDAYDPDFTSGGNLLSWMEEIANRIDKLDPDRPARAVKLFDGQGMPAVIIDTPAGAVEVHFELENDLEINIASMEAVEPKKLDIGYARANALGPKAIRDVFRELGRIFPEAIEAFGERVSGARHGTAASYEGHAYGRFKVRERDGKPERVTAAAVRIGDRIWTGPAHYSIIAHLMDLGLWPAPGIDRGFMTSRNRYVSRAEAADVSIAAKQTHPDQDHSGGLASEDVSEFMDGDTRELGSAEVDQALNGGEIDAYHERSYGDPFDGDQVSEDSPVYNAPPSAKLQKGPAMRPAPLTKGDVETLRNISLKLAAAVGVPIHQGRKPSVLARALGAFWVKGEYIRVRKLKKVDTAAHEVGHYLSKKYSLKGAVKAARKELLAAGHALYGSKKPAGGYQEEGVAEYFRFRVVDPKRAIREFPNFHAYIEQLLQKETMLKGALDQAADDFARYTAAPARAQVAAMISVGEMARSRPTIKSLVTKWLDDLEPFRKLVQMIGKPRTMLHNGYILGRLTRGDAGAAANMVEKGVVDFFTKKRVSRGLREILDDVGTKDLQAFREYLVAERALEKNDQGIDTGISSAAARTIVDADRARFEKHAAEIWKYSDALLAYLRDGGLLTIDEHKAITLKNKKRVPFYRVFAPDETGASAGSGRALARNSSGVMKMKGSDRVIIDPLESLIQDTQRIVSRANKHWATTMLIKQALNTEGAGHVAHLVDAPKKRTTMPVARILEQLQALGFDLDFDALTPDQAQDILDALLVNYEQRNQAGPSEAKDLVIPVLINGRRKWVQLKDREMWNAIQNLNVEEMNTWVKVLSKPAQLLRSGAVLTLEFLGSNVLRDAVHTAIYSRGKSHLPGYHAMRGVFEYLKHPELYDEWVLSGGSGSGMQGFDRVAYQKALSYMTEGKGKALFRIVRHPIHALRTLAEIGENSTRLGEYAATKDLAKEEGKTELEARTWAAFASRVLIDFSRAGTWGRHINSLYAFFNAQLQDLNKLAAEHNPANLKTAAGRERMATVMGRAFAIITVPSLALWFMQKDDPMYEEIPDFVKATGWVIIDRDGGPDGPVKHIWWIPRPHALGILYGYIPERIAAYLYGKDPDALSKIGKQLLQQLPGTSVDDYIPTALLPTVEVGSNYSFFRDRPIVPQTDQMLTPGHQARPWTGEAARVVGDATEVSPAKIEHFVRGHTGGLGQYGMDLANITIASGREMFGMPQLKQPAADPEDALEKIPGIRRMVIPKPGDDGESLVALYRAFDEAERARRTWQRLRAEHQVDHARSFFADHRAEIVSVLTAEDGGGTPGKLRELKEELDQLRAERQEVARSQLPNARKAEIDRRLEDRTLETARRWRKRDIDRQR